MIVAASSFPSSSHSHCFARAPRGRGCPPPALGIRRRCTRRCARRRRGDTRAPRRAPERRGRRGPRGRTPLRGGRGELLPGELQGSARQGRGSEQGGPPRRGGHGAAPPRGRQRRRRCEPIALALLASGAHVDRATGEPGQPLPASPRREGRTRRARAPAHIARRRRQRARATDALRCTSPPAAVTRAP